MLLVIRLCYDIERSNTPHNTPPHGGTGIFLILVYHTCSLLVIALFKQQRQLSKQPFQKYFDSWLACTCGHARVFFLTDRGDTAAYSCPIATDNMRAVKIPVIIVLSLCRGGHDDSEERPTHTTSVELLQFQTDLQQLKNQEELSKKRVLTNFSCHFSSFFFLSLYLLFTLHVLDAPAALQYDMTVVEASLLAMRISLC